MTIATSLLMMAKVEIDDELMKQCMSEDELTKKPPREDELMKKSSLEDELTKKSPSEDKLKKQSLSEDELKKQPSIEERLWRLLRASSPVPRVLANGIMISCIFALLATLLRNWTWSWIVVWPLFKRFSNKLLLPALANWNQPEEPKLIVEEPEAEEKERSILIAIKNKIGFGLLLILLTAFVIAANDSPDFKMPGLWLFYERWIVWKVYETAMQRIISLFNEIISRSTPSLKYPLWKKTFSTGFMC